MIGIPIPINLNGNIIKFTMWIPEESYIDYKKSLMNKIHKQQKNHIKICELFDNCNEHTPEIISKHLKENYLNSLNRLIDCYDEYNKGVYNEHLYF